MAQYVIENVFVYPLMQFGELRGCVGSAVLPHAAVPRCVEGRHFPGMIQVAISSLLRSRFVSFCFSSCRKSVEAAVGRALQRFVGGTSWQRLLWVGFILRLVAWP